jgi:hypothetical protein
MEPEKITIRGEEMPIYKNFILISFASGYDENENLLQNTAVTIDGNLAPEIVCAIVSAILQRWPDLAALLYSAAANSFDVTEQEQRQKEGN